MNYHHKIKVGYIGGTSILFLIFIFFWSCDSFQRDEVVGHGRSYYVSATGNDQADGTFQHPWRNISRINTIDFNAGDSINFQGGVSFEGCLRLDSTDTGTMQHPLVITSYGTGKSTIEGKDSSAIIMQGTRHVLIQNLRLHGSGRKMGNTQHGLTTKYCNNINLDSLEITGFQKSGLFIQATHHATIEEIHAHDNGAAGITLMGIDKKTDNKHITIRNSLAENNPGDPTKSDNHSGSGILVGLSSHVLIEFCAATNNGWDMPRKGNGPIGIWAYESDSVTISHCISYRNKTSVGGDDGGGFDLDGGMTNSVIQYCLSYENQGSGYGIFQYDGASLWKNNTIRFCISENDGLVSRANAGVFIWNGQRDANKFTDLYFYNNVIYNANAAAITFDQSSDHKRFNYYNNIFVSANQLIKGGVSEDFFLGNVWWSMADKFNLNGYRQFEQWIAASGNEKKDGRVLGCNLDPQFHRASQNPTDVTELAAFTKYRTPHQSRLLQYGVNLRSELGIDPGPHDLNLNPVMPARVGASF